MGIEELRVNRLHIILSCSMKLSRSKAEVMLLVNMQCVTININFLSFTLVIINDHFIKLLLLVTLISTCHHFFF